MTRVRNERERKVHVESLSVLARAGARIFAADGGSLPEFVSYLEGLPGVTVVSGARGLVPQVKQAMAAAAASGAEIVVYTEPDKRDFFATGFSGFIEEALGRRAAVLVAARNAAALSTFPAGQQHIEQLFNALAAFLTPRSGDWLYGPLALSVPEATRLVAAAPDDLGWGWRPYLIARLLQSGKAVEVFEGEFLCPEEQRSEDDGEARSHRLSQLENNVRGLRLGLLATQSD